MLALVLSIAAAAAVPLATRALPCPAFDTAWNLYAFGGTTDVNLGQNTTWGSPNPKTLTTTGRPSWTGQYSQCLLSQNQNKLYVLGADSSSLATVYVYDFSASSWSSQAASGSPPDLGNSRSASVLDHDTDVIYTLTTAVGMYQLDVSQGQTTFDWQAVENPSFSTTGYTVTAAQAANHINYFGVPNTPAGSADLFVVHFAYFQPTPQAYPTLNNGPAFPDTSGQAFSIPDPTNNVPLQMVFVPNDFSNTNIISHWTDLSNYSITSDAPFALDLINTTQLLPAPTSHDAAAAYAASAFGDLVQIDAAGNIYYLTSAVNAYMVQSSAQWTKMTYTLAGTGGIVANTTSSAISSASSSSGSTMSSATGSNGMTVASGASTSAASMSHSAISTASSSAASTSKSSAASERASLASFDLVGLALGLATVGAALVF